MVQCPPPPDYSEPSLCNVMLCAQLSSDRWNVKVQMYLLLQKELKQKVQTEMQNKLQGVPKKGDLEFSILGSAVIS